MSAISNFMAKTGSALLDVSPRTVVHGVVVVSKATAKATVTVSQVTAKPFVPVMRGTLNKVEAMKVSREDKAEAKDLRKAYGQRKVAKANDIIIPVEPQMVKPVAKKAAKKAAAKA